MSQMARGEALFSPSGLHAARRQLLMLSTPEHSRRLGLTCCPSFNVAATVAVTRKCRCRRISAKPPGGRIASPWLALAILASSCFVFTRVDIALHDTAYVAGTSVESPFKAFLVDGRIAVFPDGAHFTADSVFGDATLYSLDLDSSSAIEALALNSLIGLESVRGRIRLGSSIITNVMLFVGFAAVDFLVTKVFWGSCPTVYSHGRAGEVLEAEAFSYSVVPLFEGRDVDRIGAGADESGVVKLELRNEALETHYINYLALLEVRHGANRSAYPDEEGRILIVGDETGITSATDRDGSDRLAELNARGGGVFHS